MDVIDLLKKFVPNPLSEQSTVPDSEKKVEIIAESLSLVGIIKNIIFLIIIGFLLVVFLKIPISAVLILAGFEVFTTLLIAYIKYSKIKALSLLKATDEKDYEHLLVTGRYYALIRSIAGFCTSVISAGLLFLFFRQELSNLIGKASSAVSIFSLKNLVIAFVFFRFFGLVVEYIMYRLTKNIDKNQNIAQIKQKMSLINMKYPLIKNMPGMLTVLVFLSFINLPIYFIISCWTFASLIVILIFRELWRINRLNLSVQATTSVNTEYPDLIIEEKIESKLLDIGDSIVGIKDSRHIENINLHTDEKVLDTIFGIMNLKRIGAGLQMNKPENSLLITNYRLVFIQVPMAGRNAALPDQTPFGDMHFFWNRGKIKEKGEQILQNESLSEIMEKYGMREILFDDIINLTLKKMEIKILTADNKKHKYLFMDKDRIDSLKKELGSYLKERFIEAK